MGYFGKASDGMVDLQIISDIHKSEVYQLAKILKVPDSTIKAVPTGDMFDHRTDEQVFGTTYDFVELYLHYLTLTKSSKKQIINRLSAPAQKQFQILANRVEALHHYNAHKYLVDSPSVHLDIYFRIVPGGWTK